MDRDVVHRGGEIGFLWLALTLAFEFTMGLVVMKKPFRETLRDYNLAAGRVWILFLAWITAAPWVFLRLFG